MKLTIVAATVLFSLTFTVFPILAGSNGLVARWNFNSSSGRVLDSSGNNLTGIVDGAKPTPGKFGKAFDFSNGGYIRIPNNPSFEPANLSVEAWVKSDGSPGTFNYILTKGSKDCFAASYAFYTGASGGLIFYISDGTGFSLSPDAGTGIWDNKWHHITGTFDGSTVRLFVDGAEVGGGASTGLEIGYNLPSGNDIFIGKFNEACSFDFNGQIDEVRIWNKALTPREITLHSQSNSIATYPQ